MSESNKSASERAQVQTPVAVVGMACRLPGNSNSPQALWTLLERGGCATNGAPASRFSYKNHYDGSKKPNTLRSPGAMFLENVDPGEFDAAFFSISRQEAIAMDPQQRQLLEVVYECLENAGISLSVVDGASLGCFIASSTSDYRDIHARDPEDRPPNATVGLVPAILSNRISHFLNIRGPSMTIDTACSASLVSVDIACKYIQSEDIIGAVVAGCHLYLSPEANMDSGAMKEAFSPSGRCHTFDAKADGYMKAEGINAVFLKRLDYAIRDGNPIRAVIVGSATNSDGRTPGITNPAPKAQAAAIEAAYRRAGITDLNATSYLECHGTGTQVGDPVEVEAASSVLCKNRGEDPLIIGSIKGNIGHSECASGISGLIKVVLALEKGIIPGNPTFLDPNPKIDFQHLNLKISRNSLSWPTVPLRRASVNSFGFGGSNAHVILEEAKLQTDRNHVSSYQSTADMDDLFADEGEEPSNVPYILVLSANDTASLQTYFKALKRHLMYPAVRVALQDLAYTLSERRTHHFHRGFVVTKETNINSTALITGKRMNKAPRIGFVFTGQGAQWPQMGKALYDSFPIARSILCYLDQVLQNLSSPPQWSLVAELIEPRSEGELRRPFISQPLTTALQIALVELLRSWGLNPQAVVGHSSGEIAAAYCAGLVSLENAFKAAFYRGQASLKAQRSDNPAEGMLAVGLGPNELSKMIEETHTEVEIACYNSPKSTTLSGTTEALEDIRKWLQESGVFARFLRVDMAYHSNRVKDASEAYKQLLDNDFQPGTLPKSSVRMFSTVQGAEFRGKLDATYWQENMISPVLFSNAMAQMIKGKDGVDFLVEVGPSGVLAGPISEIMDEFVQKGSSVQYHPTLKRGQTDLYSLFELVGHVFISGGRVDIEEMNRLKGTKPSTIVDLPNYAWNHSTRYWHESVASKDWRYRLFPHHDLIGSKVLGTSYHSPTWKKNLKVDDLSWLRDHRLGSDIVVPGAALVVMAVEAMAQLTHALNILEDRTLPDVPCYRVRNVTFSRALVLEEGKEHTVMIALTARTGPSQTWHEFKINSLVEGNWIEHSRGLVRAEQDKQETAPPELLSPLIHSVPGELWYQAMENVGYALGPAFQKHLQAESVSGSRASRSIVSLLEPESVFPQTRYQMHPTSVDGILQACAPALWNGNRTNINAVIIPAMIDNLLICQQPSTTEKGIAVVTSSYSGLGDVNETKNYTADVSVYDTKTGKLLLQLSKLRTDVLHTYETSYNDPEFCRVSWKPDITFLSDEIFPKVCKQDQGAGDQVSTLVCQILNLAVFKNPNAKVLEFTAALGEHSSVWLNSKNEDQRTCESFVFVVPEAKSLLEAQDQYAAEPNVKFVLSDPSSEVRDPALADEKYDIVIVNLPSEGAGTASKTLNGDAIDVAHHSLSPSNEAKDLLVRKYASMLRGKDSVLIIIPFEQTSKAKVIVSVPRSLYPPVEDLDGLRHTDTRSSSSILQVTFMPPKNGVDLFTTVPRTIHLIQFSAIGKNGLRIVQGLQSCGWNVIQHGFPLSTHIFDGFVLIVNDICSSPLLSTISDGLWKAIQELSASHNNILWVTEGSQFQVTKPENAMIHGLVRTIHDEDPSVKFTTLDVEDGTGENTIPAINAILCSLHAPNTVSSADHEFIERSGVIHIARIVKDNLINDFVRAERAGAEPITRSLSNTESRIQLICEKVGMLDSLRFVEVGGGERPLLQDEVEIDIVAAGLNFKDIAISTGLIPGNQRLLGFEGAGTIRRSAADEFQTGQRVIFVKAGAFANRIIVEKELVHTIPHHVSFEEAATLGAVFPVALYSLFDLAHARPGQRVLIHSAAGGLGIACIQICQHIGAEIYATVGNEEKRQYIAETFSIPASRIYNSRSTNFASQLMLATKNEGVDVIINSLTGDLLEESWHCIREGGVMVELGKKDILQRAYLSMEPFSRNVSFKSFDISHKSVPNSVLSKLLRILFELLNHGHVSPIRPITTFSFQEAASAFRYMQLGKHMGKIVLFNSTGPEALIPVRPQMPSVRLRNDRAYIIVGGLKGLCGSIALSFARHGARHIVIMGRSGFEDRASQRVLYNMEAEGCQTYLVKGDVTIREDVKRAFAVAPFPVGGIVQGAMVVRGRLYQAMSADDFHVAIACKVLGTWNLHYSSLEEASPLQFFSLISSTSGVAGQSGQANYVAANAFLDAFAAFRQKLGLQANSIALGPMWDVGYMSRNKSSLPKTNTSTFKTITEALFHKIIGYSILQQTYVINKESASHLITGMAIPLSESSTLRSDARFAALFGSSTNTSNNSNKGIPKELQIFRLLLQKESNDSELLEALIELIGQQISISLRVTDKIEPLRPLSNYGMESLAAVELRNWIRTELQADITMLEILNATSMIALCEKVLNKIQTSVSKR